MPSLQQPARSPAPPETTRVCLQKQPAHHRRPHTQAESYDDAKEYDSPAATPYQPESYSYEKPAPYKKSRDHSHYKKASSHKKKGYAGEEPAAYEAKDSYSNAKKDYSPKADGPSSGYTTYNTYNSYAKQDSSPYSRDYSSGHKQQSFDTVCLQEVPDTCGLGLAINLDLCDILALRLSSSFECCTALTSGKDARIAAKHSRARHAAQMLQLYGNTDACRWDFTFGVDIINQVIEEPAVSGIDSPGVLPIGKAIATCFFSDNLRSCGPFCNGMTLRAEVRRCRGRAG